MVDDDTEVKQLGEKISEGGFRYFRGFMCQFTLPWSSQNFMIGSGKKIT